VLVDVGGYKNSRVLNNQYYHNNFKDVGWWNWVLWFVSTPPLK